MKLIKGYWWPDTDQQCHPVVPGQVQDLEHAIKYCDQFRTCIQAGGNVGIWPNYLLTYFEKIFTFEPDIDNFKCLKNNCTSKNIVARHAALADKPGSTGMEVDPKNVGAHRILGDGDIPVFTIDEFDFDNVDLIVLDIEGTEPQALEGAKKTIEKYKPVIMVEDKGLSEHYGVSKGWSHKFPGYKVVKEVHRDVILVPE
jgi:FkbM family methyltransferase